MGGMSPVSWPHPSTDETASLFPPCPLDSRSLSYILNHKVSVAEVGKAVARFLCGVENTAAWGQKTWVLGCTSPWAAESLCVRHSCLALSSLVCKMQGSLWWAPRSRPVLKGLLFSDLPRLEPVFHISTCKLKMKFFSLEHEARGGVSSAFHGLWLGCLIHEGCLLWKQNLQANTSEFSQTVCVERPLR